jgi:hypothetical protein
MYAGSRLTHRMLAASIVSHRCGRARVAEQRLHRREVHAHVEQVARERAPAVVWRGGGDPGAIREVTEAVVHHRLPGEPSGRHEAAQGPLTRRRSLYALVTAADRVVPCGRERPDTDDGDPAGGGPSGPRCGLGRWGPIRHGRATRQDPESVEVDGGRRGGGRWSRARRSLGRCGSRRSRARRRALG